MEKEEKFIKIISEKEGKELLREEKIIFEEKGIFLTLLIKDKIDIDYIKNIIKFLSKNKKYSFIATLISVFNENKEEKYKILDESIEKLKKEVDSIIIIPNDEKDILLAENKLKNAAERIKKFPECTGFINLDFMEFQCFIKEIIIGIYGFGSASGELKKKKVIEDLFLSIPKRYKNNLGHQFIKLETSPNVGLIETQEIAECINKDIKKDIECILFEVGVNTEFKNRIDVDAIIGIENIN